MVDFLEILLLSGGCSLSQELQINLQFRFSKNLDGFALQEFLKVCLVMSRFENVTTEFWDLAQFILEEKSLDFQQAIEGKGSLDLGRRYNFSEILKASSSEYDLDTEKTQAQNLVGYFQSVVGSKLNIGPLKQVADSRRDQLRKFDIDFENLVGTQSTQLVEVDLGKKLEAELSIFRRNSSLMDEILKDVDFKPDYTMTLFDMLDFIRIEDLEKVGKLDKPSQPSENRLIDWNVIRRAIFKHF